MTRQTVMPAKRTFAKLQRKDQTTIEEMMWHALRAKRFHGMKFKRQVPIGPFVVDFVCFQARLAIEVDGPIHEKSRAKARDAARESWLRRQDFRLIRIKGDEVITSLDLALSRVEAMLETVPSPGLR